MRTRGQGVDDKHLAKVAEGQYSARFVSVPTEAKLLESVYPSRSARTQMGEPLDGGSSVFRRKDNDKLLKRQLTAGLIHDWFAFATVAGLT